MGFRTTAHDRWLISYADFITLLFATFVLMYVAAKKNEAHHKQIDVGVLNTRTIQVPSMLEDDLTNTLSLERSNHSVTLSREPRGIVLNLDDSICFDPGRAEVRAAAVPIFQKIANTLAHYPNLVLLQGHTDSTPIHNSQFTSNWELSTSRSIAVMQLMKEQASLASDRFLVAGAADNSPVSSNTTTEGRAQNRRVDIIILDNASAIAGSLPPPNR